MNTASLPPARGTQTSRYTPLMTQQLLMIEDDRRLAGMVVDYLTHAGFDVAHAADAAEGLAWLKVHAADLVLLDLMLPDGDGLDVCRRLRADSEVPVIMLTAKGDPTDRVVGLELGADDYLPKPFEPRELLARIRAVLRQHAGNSVGTSGAARRRKHRCASAASKSIATRARCGSKARYAISPAISSRCWWRWPSVPGACFHASS